MPQRVSLIYRLQRNHTTILFLFLKIFWLTIFFFNSFSQTLSYTLSTFFHQNSLSCQQYMNRRVHIKLFTFLFYTNRIKSIRKSKKKVKSFIPFYFYSRKIFIYFYLFLSIVFYTDDRIAKKSIFLWKRKQNTIFIFYSRIFHCILFSQICGVSLLYFPFIGIQFFEDIISLQ